MHHLHRSLVALLLACLLLAEPAAASPGVSAAQAFDKMMSAYKSIKSFRIRSELEVTTHDRILKQHGDLIFERADKVRWDGTGERLDGAFHQLIVASGKTAHKYDFSRAQDEQIAYKTLTELSRVGFGADYLFLVLLDGNREEALALLGKPARYEGGVLTMQRGAAETRLSLDATSFLISGMQISGQGPAAIRVHFSYTDIGKAPPKKAFIFTSPTK